MLRPRILSISVLCLALCSLGLACSKKEEAKPETAVAPTPPEAEPDLPKQETDLPIEVPDNCNIEVVGDMELERALVTTADGTLITNTITDDGRTIQITCPDNEETRKNLDVIAEIKGEEGAAPRDNVVHWRNVDIGTGDKASEATTLESAKASPGVPPEREELVREQFGPEYGSEDEGEDEGEDTGPITPPPPSEKVSVSFSPGDLYAAQIRYTDSKGKSRELTLDKTKKKKLPPGTYSLEIQGLNDKGKWKKAGTFVVPEGKASITVELTDAPGAKVK